ncbi:MAG: hypothetical protein M1820_006723 [Bogoriella megaspora]|nr:MAG: hypothetical protein M1820_006723 [Bogoriella megaspora]
MAAPLQCVAEASLNAMGSASTSMEEERRSITLSPVTDINGTSSNSDAVEYLIAIDMGTKKLEIAWTKVNPASPVSSCDIKLVAFDDDTTETPMQATWLRRGHGLFVCGGEVETLCKEGKVIREDVIVLPKLLLYREFSDHEMSRVAQEILNRLGKTKLELFSSILRFAYDKAMHNIIKYYRTWSGSSFAPNRISRKVILPVPANFDPSQIRFLCQAAKKAGIGIVNILSEPECAAAYFISRQPDHDADNAGFMQANCKKGDRIFVCDVGGGTCDCGLYEFENSLFEEPPARLKPIGQPHGGPFGSEFVNIAYLQFCERARDFVFNTEPNLTLDQCCSTMGLDIRKVKHDICDDFEQMKVRWDDQGTQERRHVTINSNRGHSHARLLVTDDLMKSFYKDSVNGIISLMERCGAQQAASILLTGGGVKNRALRAHIKARFGIPMFRYAVGSFNTFPSPIVYGALLSRGNLARDYQKRYKYSIGITDSNQQFDARKHPDAWRWRSSGGKRKRCRRSDVVKDDPYDGGDVVENRIGHLFTVAGDLERHQEVYWQEYEIDENDGCMTAQFFFTSSGDIELGQPLYKTGSDKLREGLVLLEPELRTTFRPAHPGLGKRTGYTPKSYGYCLNDNKRTKVRFYRIQAAIVLINENGQTTYKWWIARAGKGPWAEDWKRGARRKVRTFEDALRDAVLLDDDDALVDSIWWHPRDQLSRTLSPS